MANTNIRFTKKSGRGVETQNWNAVSNCSRASISGVQKKCIAYLSLLLLFGTASSQVLSLKDAVKQALENYGTIKAKANYLRASQAAVKEASLDYLPNISVDAQQAYGTINGQFGPIISTAGLTAAAQGPGFPAQNWHSGFGGLYLANINWEFFSFGRVKEKINVAQAQLQRNQSDLAQEQFQQQVRVAAAYLNLLAAQRLKLSQLRNLERANALRNVVITRAVNGLIPGVDSSQANAEVSNAKIALNNADSYEAEQATQLAIQMGVANQGFTLDTQFVNRIPAALNDTPAAKENNHPLLQYYLRRLELSRQQEKYIGRLKYPSLALIGAVQSRGSGFRPEYGELHPSAYTHNYWEGIKPTRSNYLLGVGITWNLMNAKRVSQQLVAQAFTSEGLQNELEVVSQQVKAQQVLAEQKIKNAIANYKEAPVQMKAAADAYLQKSVLYKNGLANIVEVTQALYTLNRAETDRDIASNNVWQALLLKAAAAGDMQLFLREL